MTPRCPMYQRVETSRCPKCWGVETPRCPKYWGVTILDPLKIQNSPTYRGVVTPQKPCDRKNFQTCLNYICILNANIRQFFE